MKVIATTKTGFIIEAESGEVRSILVAVTGESPKDIKIGQKIPSIDYASTIKKIQALGESAEFRRLIGYAEDFQDTVQQLKCIVLESSSIDI